MRYIYYRVFQTFQKIKTNDTPAFNGMLFIILWQGMNILTILGIIDYFHKQYFQIEQIKKMAIVLYIFLLFVNYIFIFKKREEIFKHYENESKKERKRGTILVLTYIIGSLIAFFIRGEFFR